MNMLLDLELHQKTFSVHIGLKNGKTDFFYVKDTSKPSELVATFIVKCTEVAIKLNK